MSVGDCVFGGRKVVRGFFFRFYSFPLQFLLHHLHILFIYLLFLELVFFICFFTVLK